MPTTTDAMAFSLSQAHDSSTDPHADQPVIGQGAPINRAKAAMIMLHGRGASAHGLLRLADEFDQPDVLYRAPQAAGRVWYPYSFLAPIEDNEPGLSSALGVIADLIAELEEEGFPRQRIALLGFSQGACLALEFAARHPARYGGVIGLSGGLIGPEGASFDYSGDLENTPVFLGCSDSDPHIPLDRVHESAEVFQRLGADVTERIYEGMGHTVNDDEITFVQELLPRLVQEAERT